MLEFSNRKRSRRAARPDNAERKLAYGVDHRTKRVKKFAFSDIFRDADQQAELAMLNPRPSPQFRKFFAQFAQPRLEKPAEQRLDASFPSASGARLALLI